MLPTPRTRLRGTRPLGRCWRARSPALAVLMGATAAQAADEATIDYVEAADGGCCSSSCRFPPAAPSTSTRSR